MKGLWSLSEENKKRVLQKLKAPPLYRIVDALRVKGDVGLSNAEIDSLLEASSQWLIFWDLRELLALGIIEYDVQFFGEPGKYHLTETGLSILNELKKERD